MSDYVRSSFERWTAATLLSFAKSLDVCDFMLDGDIVRADLPGYAKLEMELWRYPEYAGSNSNMRAVFYRANDTRNGDGWFEHGFVTTCGLANHIKWFVNDVMNNVNRREQTQRIGG